MDGLHEDDGNMPCSEHPFKNNTPAGGICALCLQDKLGKLVSSSFPITVFPSSSSSSSPSFRSDVNASRTTITTTITTTTVSSVGLQPGSGSTLNTRINPGGNKCHYHHYYSNNSNNNNNNSGKSGILYLLGQKKKKTKENVDNKNVVFKRSKSTVTPRCTGPGGGGGGGLHYVDSDNGDGLTSPHKRGFWSFLYLQKHGHSSSNGKKTLRDISSNSLCASFPPQTQRSGQDTIVVEENDSPCHATFDRKVSRSRSVGCGSRSFSGDFFERISTGFGDCTLRRVESHREGKSKVSALRAGSQDSIKERVRCGGLFSGFMITSSSSSSSSSSYWVASNPNNEGNNNHAGKMTSATPSATVRLSHQHSRSKSWGWALASPMRAFSKPTSSSNKKATSNNKNPTPNLSAIPSLLSVRS